MTADSYIYTRPRTKRPLSPQREKVMAFILAETNAGRGFPNNKAIAKHMGWKNPGSVSDVLVALAAWGWLQRLEPEVRKSASGEYVLQPRKWKVVA